jgi:pimeloyl-ACP methyl ester carboxylesterase
MPTTQVGSHIVYYDEHGTGQPLLLIAGLGASRLSWRKQIEPLAQRYRVIAMDNRDVGNNALSSTGYTIADLANDAAGVIQNLQLGAFHVMGWSMGGMIAQELAVRHSALVKKLILVATGAGGSTHVPAAPEVSALLMRDANEEVEVRVRRSYATIAGLGFSERNPEDVAMAIQLAKDNPINLEGYQRQLGAVMTHMGGNMPERLSHIKAPTLVIHGDYDPLVPYPNGQFLAANISGAKLSTYSGVGHLPPVEATERFNREVMEFLG